MGIFKKKKNVKDYGTEALFKEAIREINELYDDVKSEYSDIESVISDFSNLVEEMKGRLDAGDAQKLEEMSTRLKTVDRCSKNTVRDIRDVLRNHKKRLAEIKRDRD